MAAKWTEERKQQLRETMLAKRNEAKVIDNNLLQKVETFNNEVVPEREEGSGMTSWSEQDKIDSITNTIKILPPNMIKNGRHSIENIQALNCFKVTDDLIDKAYANFTHEPY